MYFLLPCLCVQKTGQEALKKTGFLLWWMLFAASSHAWLIWPWFWSQFCNSRLDFGSTDIPWQGLILIFCSRESSAGSEMLHLCWEGPSREGHSGCETGGAEEEEEFHTTGGVGKGLQAGLGSLVGTDDSQTVPSAQQGLQTLPGDVPGEKLSRTSPWQG